MSNSRKELGERIRRLRKSAGFTQEKLGEMAGLSYKFIGELERGQVNVSLDSLVRIAKSIGIKTKDLFTLEKVSVQRVSTKEQDKLSKLSKQDLMLLKKATRLLNKIF